MTTFPITYIAVIIWLILITYDAVDYWERIVAKWMGVFLGILTAIYSFNGEQWLNVDNSLAYTMTQFKDGFQLPLSLILLAMSIFLAYNLAMSLINKDYEKPTANRLSN